MQVHYFTTKILLQFDKEIGTPVLFEEAFSGEIADMPRMKKTDWEARMNGSVPGSAVYGIPENSPLEGLLDVPVSSSSGPHPPIIQPYLGFVPAQPEHMSSFLTPETCLSDQTASPVSDAVGSLCAWSSTSDAEMPRSVASSVGPVASTSSSPFVQPYYSYGASQPPISSQFQGISGYTSQEIDRWCMESDQASSLYQTNAPYPAINSLPFSSPEIPSNVYPASLDERMSTSTELWFRTPSFAGPSSIAGPASDVFLSPASPPAVSISSSSAMSTSPAPTLSDFESPSSRHQLASPPSNPADLTRYGIPAGAGVWRCAYPACTSQALFRRGCDLRKHFNRHRKHLFCRHEDCPQSSEGGFSSKKDRARHEAKHNPGVVCEWDGCGRVFSRVDNMKDHMRRIHRGGSR